MKTAISTIAATTAALVVVLSAQAGNPDPRKCAIGATKMPATWCAGHAATDALRRNVSRRLGQSGLGWTADITCTPKAPKLLVVACTWRGAGGDYGTGAATVTFRGTANGWRTLVVVLRHAATP